MKKFNEFGDKIIDLSQFINEEMPVSVGGLKIRLDFLKTMEKDKRNVEVLTLCTHTGTHIDAPYHFIQDGMTIDKIPIVWLMSRGILIRCPKNPGEKIVIDDIAEHLDSITAGDFILFDTNFERFLPKDEETYLVKYPHLDIEVARTLIKNGVRAICVNTPSVDKYGDAESPVHHLLLKRNILIIENLSNLNKLSEGREIIIIALPLKLHNTGGAPARVIAIEK